LNEKIETEEGKLRENERALDENLGRYDKYEEDMKNGAEKAAALTENKYNDR
jgi:hypothetical protein